MRRGPDDRRLRGGAVVRLLHIPCVVQLFCAHECALVDLRACTRVARVASCILAPSASISTCAALPFTHSNVLCTCEQPGGADELAAKCQERIARIGELQNEFYEVAAASMEASKLYIKAKDMQAAVASLQRARNLYVQHGKISQAARACKELATALKENGDKDSTLLALESYMEAARMYETDSSYSEMVRTAALLIAYLHDAVQPVHVDAQLYCTCTSSMLALALHGCQIFEAAAILQISSAMIAWSSRCCRAENLRVHLRIHRVKKATHGLGCHHARSFYSAADAYMCAVQFCC